MADRPSGSRERGEDADRASERARHEVATMEELAPSECWDLMCMAEVGRLAFVVDGAPLVLPVNYALDGRTVVFRTTDRSVLVEAAMQRVAFEVDRLDDAARAAWSVMVRGRAVDISAAVNPNAIRIRSLPLPTWAPGPRPHWFEIEPSEVTGRRIRVLPDAL